MGKISSTFRSSVVSVVLSKISIANISRNFSLGGINLGKAQNETSWELFHIFF
jgi:hypothetical protein